jgi:hypothetical protein
MRRDRELEREFLERAARDPEFAPRCTARLDEGELRFGPSGLDRLTLLQVVVEVAEEGLDSANWGVLGVQLPPPAGVPPDILARVHEMLADAAEWGARIDLLMRGAEVLLAPYFTDG